MDPVSDAELARLLEQLKHDSSTVRHAAAIAVGRLGKAATTEEISSSLADLLDHEQPMVRGSAATALRHLLGPRAMAPPEILLRLANLFQDETRKSDLRR